MFKRKWLLVLTALIATHVGAANHKNTLNCLDSTNIQCILEDAVNAAIQIPDEQTRINALSEIMYLAAVHGDQQSKAAIVGIAGAKYSPLMRSIDQAVVDGKQNTPAPLQQQPDVVQGLYWVEMGHGYLKKKNDVAVIVAMDNARRSSAEVSRRLFLHVIEDALLRSDEAMAKIARAALEEDMRRAQGEEKVLQLIDIAIAYIRGADVRAAEELVGQADWTDIDPAQQQDVMNFLLAMKHAAFGEYDVAFNVIANIKSSRLSFEAYTEMASLWLADSSDNPFGRGALKEAQTELEVLEPFIDASTKAKMLIFIASKMPRRS